MKKNWFRQIFISITTVRFDEVIYIYTLQKQKKRDIFGVEKLGEHYLMASYIFNITTNVINELPVPPDAMHWEGHNITYIVLLPKITINTKWGEV